MISSDSNYCQVVNDSGIVIVAPINRDEGNINEYEFMIDACETMYPDTCSNLSITFYINDINDCTPEFVDIESLNDTAATVTEKQVSLTFNENFNQDLDFTFGIIDKDTPINGIFELTLQDSDNSKINVAEAFQLLPFTGMSSTENVKVSVINPKILDYEDADWNNFEFTVERELNESLNA